jgi:hypothetical protein
MTMLHENPAMVDIDVNHWRNMQSLLLESAKEKRRIVVLHEDGEVLKFVHSGRAEIVRKVDRVDDPHAVAERVFRDNEGRADFVAVFERRAFDRFFGQIQDAWRPDEDLDEFVHRTYATMDEYVDGIVTYPGPARATLGLQWRIGAGYADVKSAVERFVPPRSTVVFGVFDGNALWATLVLGFDEDRRIDLITTVDPSELSLERGRQRLVDDVVAWVNARYDPCSIALFTDLEGARGFLARTDKRQALAALASRGALWVGAVPDALTEVMPETAA